LAAGKRRICRANGSSGESAARLSAVRGLAWDGRSCQVALANLLLPNRSCQIDEVIVAQPAAAAVADRAPNRNRPSDAPPITTRRLYAIWRGEPGDAKDCHAGGPKTWKPHTSAKASYPQAVNCLNKARVLKFLPQAVVGWVRMSNRGPVAAETIVQFAPKPNAKPEAGDPIDRAAQAILGLLHRTAADAEAKNQQALGMTHQLSAQLRAAEDRIRDLEAHLRHHQERADRAERWLYRISQEIEQQFFGLEEARPSQPQPQPPPPQALFRSQRH
jgi:hypothetical protein